MAIGKQVRKYRLKLKWKQKQLSEASGVDIGTISALEVRDSKSSEHFLPIAKAFGLTLEQLADETRDWPIDITAVGQSPKPSHRVELEAAPYGWPFKTVTMRDYARLSAEQAGVIEQTILAFANAGAAAEKQAAPESSAPGAAKTA